MIGRLKCHIGWHEPVCEVTAEDKPELFTFTAGVICKRCEWRSQVQSLFVDKSTVVCGVKSIGGLGCQRAANHQGDHYHVSYGHWIALTNTYSSVGTWRF